MLKKNVLIGSSMHGPLMDIEHDIADTVCTFYHLKFYQRVMLNQSKCPIYSALVHQRFFSNFIPQAYLFREFIHWLVSVMYPKKFYVMNQLGENIFQVFSLLIRQ